MSILPSRNLNLKSLNQYSLLFFPNSAIFLPAQYCPNSTKKRLIHLSCAIPSNPKNTVTVTLDLNREKEYKTKKCINRRFFSMDALPPNDRTEIIHDNIRVNDIKGTIASNGEGIQVHQYAEMYRRFTVNDISFFGHLIGDLNPIHFVQKEHNENGMSSLPFDSELTKKSKENAFMLSASFKSNGISNNPLVHGQLISSLASSIFGTLTPGAIYRSQNLTYRKPVYANDLLKCRLVIEKLRPFQNGIFIICDMKVFNYGSKNYNDNEHDDFNGGSEQGEICVDGEVKVWIPKQ